MQMMRTVGMEIMEMMRRAGMETVRSVVMKMMMRTVWMELEVMGVEMVRIKWDGDDGGGDAEDDEDSGDGDDGEDNRDGSGAGEDNGWKRRW